MSQNSYVPPDMASIMGLVDTHLRWEQLQQIDDRKYFKYHPSEWGKCLRSQQYKHFAQLGHIDTVSSTHSSKLLRVFDTGHSMHDRWQQKYFASMGILRGRWWCPKCEKTYGKEEKYGIFCPEKCTCDYDGKLVYREVTVYSDELNMTGHVDLLLDFSKFDPSIYKGVRKTFNADVLPKEIVVVDMKSCNDFSWKGQVMKFGVHPANIVQINIYMHLLDLNYGAVIYENKNDSAMAAFKIEKNNRMIETIKWQAEKMQELAKHEPRPLLPPPKPSEKSCYECQGCGFKDMCHSSKIWDKKTDLLEKQKRFYRNLL
jgi:hypothetical protein